MGLTVNEQVALTTTDCCVCGVVFAMPQTMYNDRKNKGGSFYCPNGHPMHFTEPEVTKLLKKLESTQRDRDLQHQRLLEAEKSLSAQKGINTKLKKRIANGVCPCCHRQFTNLHRHMTTKHPDYEDSVDQPAE